MSKELLEQLAQYEKEYNEYLEVFSADGEIDSDEQAQLDLIQTYIDGIRDALTESSEHMCVDDSSDPPESPQDSDAKSGGMSTEDGTCEEGEPPTSPSGSPPAPIKPKFTVELPESIKDYGTIQEDFVICTLSGRIKLAMSGQFTAEKKTPMAVAEVNTNLNSLESSATSEFNTSLGTFAFEGDGIGIKGVFKGANIPLELSVSGTTIELSCSQTPLSWTSGDWKFDGQISIKISITLSGGAPCVGAAVAVLTGVALAPQAAAIAARAATLVENFITGVGTRLPNLTQVMAVPLIIIIPPDMGMDESPIA